MDNVTASLARELGLDPRQVAAVDQLQQEGATVPFIARYRKEATLGLDEVQIRLVLDGLKRQRELEERRTTVLRELERQGVLDAAMKAKVLGTTSRSELEDLYLPFRPKRRTRSTIAREKGLEPLAQLLWEQRESPQAARRFVSAERGVATPDEALAGARDICAERLAEDPELRRDLRDALRQHGLLVARKARGKKQEATRFDDYDGYSEPIRRIAPHRVHALARGEREGVLKVEVTAEGDRELRRTEARLRIRAGSPWREDLVQVAQDAWDRLLLPSLGGEIREDLLATAHTAAADVFAKNLHSLLLAPPLGMFPVLAVDPGQRTGSKMVALGATGELLGTAVLEMVHGDRKLDQARQTFLSFCERHRPRAVAVGNGTQGRETEQQLREWARILPAGGQPLVVAVSETGASIYSASDIARKEFPDLDLTFRGAVSIGRRLQDPLAELVKIDPQHLGVGQYQHDVPAELLKSKLDQVVETAVNSVGVELNTASSALLTHVAGIGPGLAQRIVDYRAREGQFRSRKELLRVAGIGPKTFQQAAGFLLVRGGSEPLDASAVHPERYDLVQRIARSANLTVQALLGNPEALKKISWSTYQDQDTGSYTLNDIKKELEQPGRDPREDFTAASFRDDIRTLEDLKEGMELEGVITNVTRFGAFVDLGVKVDGLVHVSQLADRFISDPSEVAQVGHRIRVRVVGIDRVRKRISLSARSN